MSLAGRKHPLITLLNIEFFAQWGEADLAICQTHYEFDKCKCFVKMYLKGIGHKDTAVPEYSWNHIHKHPNSACNQAPFEHTLAKHLCKQSKFWYSVCITVQFTNINHEKVIVQALQLQRHKRKRWAEKEESNSSRTNFSKWLYDYKLGSKQFKLFVLFSLPISFSWVLCL